MWKAASSAFWHMNQPKDILCTIAVPQGSFRGGGILCFASAPFKTSTLPLKLFFGYNSSWTITSFTRWTGYKQLSGIIQCLSPSPGSPLYSRQNVFKAPSCAEWLMEHYRRLWPVPILAEFDSISCKPQRNPLLQRNDLIGWRPASLRFYCWHTCRKMKCQNILPCQGALLVNVINITVKIICLFILFLHMRIIL